MTRGVQDIGDEVGIGTESLLDRFSETGRGRLPITHPNKSLMLQDAFESLLCHTEQFVHWSIS
jgi:hypothetical protein